MHITCNEGEEEVSGWIINLFANGATLKLLLLLLLKQQLLLLYIHLGQLVGGWTCKELLSSVVLF